MLCLRVPCADPVYIISKSYCRGQEEEEGMALLEKAAGQGHAYAMFTLGSILVGRRIDYAKAVEWHTKGAEAGRD